MIKEGGRVGAWECGQPAGPLERISRPTSQRSEIGPATTLNLPRRSPRFLFMLYYYQEKKNQNFHEREESDQNG